MWQLGDRVGSFGLSPEYNTFEGYSVYQPHPYHVNIRICCQISSCKPQRLLIYSAW